MNGPNTLSKSTNDVRNLSAPRPPMPDTLQSKTQETGFAINRATAIANEILDRLTGPANMAQGTSDAISKASPNLHSDAADNFVNAHELENLMMQIRASIFNT